MNADHSPDLSPTEAARVTEHPGITFRGPTDARRAGLVDGPDVWELVERFRIHTGSEEERLAIMADELRLRPDQLRRALRYYAAYPDEVTARIRENEEAAKRVYATARSGRLRIGDRVRALGWAESEASSAGYVDDNQTVPPGTEGTVTFVDDTGTIFCKWDNGSTIGLVAGADRWEFVNDREPPI